MKSDSRPACGEHATVDHVGFVDTAEGTPSCEALVECWSMPKVRWKGRSLKFSGRWLGIGV